MRKKRKLLWQLFPSYLMITILSLVVIAWTATSAVRALYVKHTIGDLSNRAAIVAKLLEDKFSEEHAAEIDAFCKEAGTKGATHITIVLPSGVVLGDSERDPARLDNFAVRPEVKEALAGHVGVSERYSFTATVKKQFVALPVKKDGRLIGIVRTAVPVTEIVRTLRPFYLRLLLEVLVIAGVAALLGFYVSHRISKTAAHLRKGAVRFAEGDLEHRLEVPASEELGTLAEAMNSMAAKLHENICAITSQRNELEAVLSSMVEAVLVIDSDKRIVRINRAAENLFDIKMSRVAGRTLREAIRNRELHRFVENTFAGSELVEGDIVSVGEPDRFLQAHGVTLRDADGKAIGALVIFHDVTRLKTLENIRRDFVTNVSHELRTPITTMKGFLETLRDGAIDDTENSRRFLDIIIKHTDRLDMIIEDLLSLSRIERDADKGEIHLEEAPIDSVLEAVHRTCAKKAEEKTITLQFRCPEELTAKINPTLLEQALANLVDNALKFSDPGQTVNVEVEKTSDEVIIKVVDKGCGIPRGHLTRIFERFYRVDKARSREEGGTGLGLAIVKHIVNAHRGRVEVKSSPGEGSTFAMHLPTEKG